MVLRTPLPEAARETKAGIWFEQFFYLTHLFSIWSDSFFYIVIGDRACLTKEGLDQLSDLKDYKLSKDEGENLKFSTWEHTTVF